MLNWIKGEKPEETIDEKKEKERRIEFGILRNATEKFELAYGGLLPKYNQHITNELHQINGRFAELNSDFFRMNQDFNKKFGEYMESANNSHGFIITRVQSLEATLIKKIDAQEYHYSNYLNRIERKIAKLMELLNALNQKSSGPIKIESANIDELNLSRRATTPLKESGLILINDVINKTDDELLAIHKFGRRCLDETREAISLYIKNNTSIDIIE